MKALLTKRSPYYIQFYITGRCNLKCRQCNIVETNSALHEVTLEEIDTIAANIRSIGGGIVLLTGGEPFVRQDVHEIVTIFLRHGLDVRLQSAGLATREQIEACHRAGARDINVSLDSLVEEKQDYINAVPGSWRKAIHCLERISRVFNRESSITSLGCVLSRFNYREIPAILEFATEIGWHLSLVPVHISAEESTYGFRSYDDMFLFDDDSYAELEGVLKQVIEMKRAGAHLFDSERFIESAFTFLKTGRPTWRKNDVCDSADLYFAVRPNGDFAVCCDHNFGDHAPSLLSPDFVAQYQNREVQKRCDPIVKACPGCHYGSYPEATLSVRDPRAFVERARLSLSMKRSRILQDFEDGEFFEILDRVKQRHADVYEKPMPPDIAKRVEDWREFATRRELLKTDEARRVREGRVRARPDREEPVSASSPSGPATGEPSSGPGAQT
ncbi:MAG: radical SAM protein [Verrucomicrobia bacterium]|nr:radical SAM protein [Verrucomicrobiota bacterium]MDA1086874.1 radical SAM protein [Verrucomicrobiota bacterium]